MKQKVVKKWDYLSHQIFDKKLLGRRLQIFAGRIFATTDFWRKNLSERLEKGLWPLQIFAGRWNWGIIGLHRSVFSFATIFLFLTRSRPPSKKVAKQDDWKKGTKMIGKKRSKMIGKKGMHRSVFKLQHSAAGLHYISIFDEILDPSNIWYLTRYWNRQRDCETRNQEKRGSHRSILASTLSINLIREERATKPKEQFPM